MLKREVARDTREKVQRKQLTPKRAKQCALEESVRNKKPAIIQNGIEIFETFSKLF